MKIGVIIPAYNASKFLEQTIASVKAQTVQPDEIILVDDGSMDGTVALARELGLTVLEQENSGPSVARNKGVRHSSADIIFLLDADDVWLPTKIESHLAVWKTGHRGPVLDQVQRVRANGSKGGIGGKSKHPKISWEDFVNPESWTCGSSPSFRREDYLAINGFREDLRFAEDIEFMIRYAHEFGDGHCIQQPLTEYRLSPHSASNISINPREMANTFKETLTFLNKNQERELFSAFALHQMMQMQGIKYLRLPMDAVPILLKQKKYYRILAIKMLKLLLKNRLGFGIAILLFNPTNWAFIGLCLKIAKVAPIIFAIATSTRFWGRKGNANVLLNARRAVCTSVDYDKMGTIRELPIGRGKFKGAKFRILEKVVTREMIELSKNTSFIGPSTSGKAKLLTSSRFLLVSLAVAIQLIQFN